MSIKRGAFVAMTILLAITACYKKEEKNTSLEAGDIIFQDLDCGPLCDAIESVTRGVNDRKFSHCGIVIIQNDSLKVAEAIGESVRITPINYFLERSGDTGRIKNIIIGRLKEPYRNLIDAAADFSAGLDGQPYDFEFIPDNGKWYCSELIHEAFRHANKGNALFELEPMTFKDPRTGAFYPAWEEYYQKLGKPIPEGVPGINPGLLSRSPAFEIIYPSGISQY